MEHPIQLLAGTPNDENRDYLPAAIKGSDMVVNENGNNSQVYPKRLKEYHEILVGEEEDVWYEYVPASYNPTQKTPLVFSMHGGLMTGWGQAVYTSWTHVADREGFILVFPNAHERRFWQIECPKDKIEECTTPNESGVFLNEVPEQVSDSRDVKMVFALIKKMKEKYLIDEKRLYMQGMSMGNAMTAMMARHFGYVFAGMAGSAGCASEGLLFQDDGSLINEGGPVNIWQSRGEIDSTPPGSNLSYEEAVEVNREYWLQVNGCKELPQIKIDGENNFAFYKGEKADYVFRDVKNRDHGQTFDDAELVWDYLFSGSMRAEDGRILRENSLESRTKDAVSFAVGKDSAFIWVNGEKKALPAKSFLWKKLKYHGLNGEQIVRGEYHMVPAISLAEAFGYTCEISADGGTVCMKSSIGTVLQFARGCIGCVVNNRIRSMLCEAVQRGNLLFLPAEWFCREIMQLQTSTCRNVMYSTDHYAELSGNMAKLIQNLLKG